jgi:hypothetical protein
MKIRLFIDEDAMYRSLVNGLRARGVDVITVLDVDRAGIEDEKQLEYAARTKRVLYTCNIGDFHRLHKEWIRRNKSHYGIIFVPQQRYSIGDQIRRILHLSAVKTSEEMENQIEFLSMW